MNIPTKKEERVCGECNHFAARGGGLFGSCRREEPGSRFELRAYDEIPSHVCKDFIPKGYPRACSPSRKHHQFRGRRTLGNDFKNMPEIACKWCGKTWKQLYGAKR